MRWSIGFFSLPRQYAAAFRMSLNAGMNRVVGRCGPRQRSFQHSSPVFGVEVVVDGQLAAAHLDVRAVVGRTRSP